jgi:alkanesulfonate monooxygenase SsuD/methylene tetrahydromethanopterin reductase-like flavin-dependent oxidoreductase (luciferase family)
MKLGIVIPTFDQFANAGMFRGIVAALERLDFDSAWFGDHVLLPKDTPAYLSAEWMDAVTCAIAGLGMTSGFDVLVAPYRSAVVLAKMAATAAQLFGGRLIVGLGIGWLAGEFETVGAPPFAERAQVTEEYLQAIRALFESEGPVTYGGKWVNFVNASFAPRPIPAPPLLVGGNHRKALCRAAMLGDGWHPLFMAAEDYARGRAAIEQIRSAAGITRPFAFSYSAPQTRLLAPGVPQIVKPPVTELAPESSAEYVPPLPTDSTGRRRFIGTAAQLREDIACFAEAGVEQIVLRPTMPRDGEIGFERFLEQLELLAAEVLPLCRAFASCVPSDHGTSRELS